MTVRPMTIGQVQEALTFIQARYMGDATAYQQRAHDLNARVIRELCHIDEASDPEALARAFDDQAVLAITPMAVGLVLVVADPVFPDHDMAVLIGCGPALVESNDPRSWAEYRYGGQS